MCDVSCLHHFVSAFYRNIPNFTSIAFKIVVFDFILLCDFVISFVISEEAYEISEVSDPLFSYGSEDIHEGLVYIQNIITHNLDTDCNLY